MAVVACACAIVIATPVIVLASVGSAAHRGLVVEGGDILERLATVDALVVDKPGTLTTGRPRLTDVAPVADGLDAQQLLAAVAAVEQRSEHPLARAVVVAAGHRLAPVDGFTAQPGRGVAATLAGRHWLVGTRQLLTDEGMAITTDVAHLARSLEAEGKTVLLAEADGRVTGVLALADTLRDDAAAALAELRALGIHRQLLLTGDNERAAAAIAAPLGIDHRAGLLPNTRSPPSNSSKPTGTSCS